LPLTVWKAAAAVRTDTNDRFDPKLNLLSNLKHARINGTEAGGHLAREWYEKATRFGSQKASQRLMALEHAN
jgi:hypothetical protein